MNWGMIGHEWAVNLLAEHVAQGQERHAYLITGSIGSWTEDSGVTFCPGIELP